MLWLHVRSAAGLLPVKLLLAVGDGYVTPSFLRRAAGAADNGASLLSEIRVSDALA
jgi:hypothetical protein